MHPSRTLRRLGLALACALALPAGAQQLNTPYTWARHAGGLSDDTGRAIAVDAVGNVYVAGRFIGQAMFDSTTAVSRGGAQDIFLTKYDAQGVVQWVRSAGGPGNDSAIGVGVDAAGNAYVVGYFIGSCAFDSATSLQGIASYDVFLAKYDATGQVQWARRAGGTGDDEGWGVSVDALGNAAITGYYDNAMTISPTLSLSTQGRRPFVIHYDPQGQATWAQTISAGNGHGRGVSLDGLGNTYVTGNASTNGSPTNRSADIFVAKYDSTGAEQWIKKFGDRLTDMGISVAADGYGSVFVAGRMNGAVMFDSVTRVVSHDENMFLAKYDGAGQLAWVRQGGGTGSDYATSVAVDQFGNPFVTGFFDRTAQFGPYSLSSGSSLGAFRVWYDYQGAILGAQAPTSSGGSIGYGVTQDLIGNTYITGAFSGQATFDAFGLTSAGNLDAYVAKVNTAMPLLHPARVTGLRAASAAPSLAVYPNPAADRLTISLTGAGAPSAELRLHDALGRLRLTRRVRVSAGTAAITLELAGQAAGIYTLQVISGSTAVTRRVVVQ